jgi:hypothetical protein
MEDFSGRLAPHLRQVADLLSTLSHSDGPRLGDFYHAQLIEQHYQALRRDFLVRMRRLVLALAVMEASVDSISDAFEAGKSAGLAQLKAAVGAMSDGVSARATLASDAAVAAVLRLDPLLNQAVFDPPDETVSDGHING